MTVAAEHGVQVKTVGEILSEDLRIPPYQRPYSWTPATALQLLDDISEACSEAEKKAEDGRSEHTYVLGSVILYADSGDQQKQVVDGQQRLLTLTMLLRLLGEHLGGQSQAANAGDEDPRSAVVVVRSELGSRIRLMSRSDAARLARFIRERCQVVRVETNDPDEAFRVFDSQNYRGKSLMPHDLLKAYHLRAMRGETSAMRAALVESWESVEEDELDRLFASYLWRINRWSRGLLAPAFATRHIETFKGIKPRYQDTPSARYHRTAQAALPMLATLSDRGLGARASNRSRFQLDAPVEAGRGFFEMTEFMRRELISLRRSGFEKAWGEFASTDEDFQERPSKARYRYVSELYLASLLYYTNKFGDEDLAEAKQRLFRWAFSVRASYQRVQLATIQNRARAQGYGESAFVLLRGAEVPTQMRHLKSEVEHEVRGNDHEATLVNLLEGMIGR